MDYRTGSFRAVTRNIKILIFFGWKNRNVLYFPELTICELNMETVKSYFP